MNLLDALSSGPSTHWVVAKVDAIVPETRPGAGRRLNLRIPDIVPDPRKPGVGGHDITLVNAAFLASYTPVVGDTVHALMQDNRGILVLGKLGV